MASDTIHVAQLSDTHFLAPGETAEGGFAYDTFEAFGAVHEHLESHYAKSPADLIVITGDVADHGRPAQYRRAAEAFASFTAPVNACPGNHDQDMAFTAGMGRPTIGTSRAIEMGPWCFLFADSNRGVMVEDETGRLVDPDNYDDRLHTGGALGSREATWIRDMCSSTEADHVFIWLHHPPGAPTGLTKSDTYNAEWDALLPDLDNVRGMAGGHTHVPLDYVFHDRPVFVSPALKNNFDLDNNTLLPPGYRTFTFEADGSVASDVQVTDDARWARHPLGRAVIALMNGELSWDDFNEITERKLRERSAQ